MKTFRIYYFTVSIITEKMNFVNTFYKPYIQKVTIFKNMSWKSIVYTVMVFNK